MGKEAVLKSDLFQAIIQYARDNHTEAIDKAYSYFWDELEPDEFLGGTALELGFHNFEDWLVFDRSIQEDGQTLIDLYIQRGGLSEAETALLERLKGTVLSLFEVISVSKDKRFIIKDLLLDGEYSLRDKNLTRGLKKGDIFATRLLDLDGNWVMSGCVYPFTSAQRKRVLAYIDKQFSRYKRNVRPDGGMRDYLKQYGDVFNLVWVHIITNPPEEAVHQATK